MTHPAREARAPEGIHSAVIPITMPTDLWLAIYKAACLARTPPTKLIVDVLRDAFPSGEA